MMAHGRPASRHGRYDAFRTEFTTETSTDELPSQSVFSYDGTEDVRRARENPTVSKQQSGHRKAMAHGVIPSGPVVAVHMFDVSSDKSDSRDTSPTASSQLRRWSRETLDGSDGFPPASPRPPSTPRASRPGSMRRRSLSGQRAPSGQARRPRSSSRSSRDVSLDQEEPLPPMTALRPQSSIGKYRVLPSISPKSGSPNPLQDSLHVDSLGSSRSDGSEDQRGMEEMEYLTSRLAHQALVENSRKNATEGKEGVQPNALEGPVPQDEDDRRRSRESARSSPFLQGKRDSLSLQLSGGTPAEGHRKRRGSSASSNTTSSELATERSHTSLSHYKMDEALRPPAEGQVLLGIKIPTDGTRHKQYFNKRDQLRCIVLFAEEVSGEDFSNHVLVQATPRQRFDNLSQTIEAAGLESKSVVHLEELD